MKPLDLRETAMNTFTWLANFDRLKIIYYITITIYIIMRMFIKRNVSPYDIIIVFPGLYLAGYMLKYADDDARKYGLVGYLILYSIYYFIVLLLTFGSIDIILEYFCGINIPYI